MSSGLVELYFVLGATGSDRRALLADLISEGLPADAHPYVALNENEPPAPADDALRRAKAEVVRWSWQPPKIAYSVPPDATHLFLLADGRANPVDQVEALREWLADHPRVRLARILLWVNARLAHAQPALLPWFEACAHFADVVLVTKREGVEAKWLADFEKHFRDQQYPFLLEVVRGFTVKNPALILTSEARRVSQVFDEPMELADESDEEIEAAKPENDRYFAWKPGGFRVMTVPDIRKFV